MYQVRFFFEQTKWIYENYETPEECQEVLKEAIKAFDKHGFYCIDKKAAGSVPLYINKDQIIYMTYVLLPEESAVVPDEPPKPDDKAGKDCNCS